MRGNLLMERPHSQTNKKYTFLQDMMEVALLKESHVSSPYLSRKPALPL